ncbi:hypothetical protein ACU686_24765 [Yinghuangia aomiensis]
MSTPVNRACAVSDACWRARASCAWSCCHHATAAEHRGRGDRGGEREARPAGA